jgi:ribosome recycling factor
MPPLTEQRRKDLVKAAKGHGEECKVAIRKARHECRDMLAEIVNDGNASEDDVERATKKMEEIVQEGVAKVEEILATKEKDIMTI